MYGLCLQAAAPHRWRIAPLVASPRAHHPHTPVRATQLPPSHTHSQRDPANVWFQPHAYTPSHDTKQTVTAPHAMMRCLFSRPQQMVPRATASGEHRPVAGLSQVFAARGQELRGKLARLLQS